MTTTTQTLADWLLGCIAEDEAVARTASPGPWHTDGEEVRAVDDITVCDAFALSGPQTRATADHIARHDPAHVLAVCAAHRAIVELHTPTDQPEYCPVCVDHAGGFIWEDEAPSEDYPCPTLRALALAYADRPGFREEWRP